ncbi:MAG: hypothetical protein PHQ86_02540 [Dehalococcoidales bacterium]|nr:hypothetical protein [Dehalococcoidales bacterium]
MRYLKTDGNFVDEWAEQRYGLADLLYETIRIDKPPAVPLQPSLVEESLYQNLYSWFGGFFI